MAITPALARDIGAGGGRPVAFHLGDLAVGPERVEVGAPKLDGEDVLAHLFSPLPVEAILPASVLARYELALDMAAGRMILAPPRSIAPQGVAVPIRIDADTGVAAVDAEIANELSEASARPDAPERGGGGNEPAMFRYDESCQ